MEEQGVRKEWVVVDHERVDEVDEVAQDTPNRTVMPFEEVTDHVYSGHFAANQGKDPLMLLEEHFTRRKSKALSKPRQGFGVKLLLEGQRRDEVEALARDTCDQFVSSGHISLVKSARTPHLLDEEVCVRARLEIEALKVRDANRDYRRGDWGEDVGQVNQPVDDLSHHLQIVAVYIVDD